ncbi:MAG: SulP family inorganic anion transporter [Lachnospiraceae bacterium]|nr:SulP family inorganic anion transporter [Lachnospiraceae bacterium]
MKKKERIKDALIGIVIAFVSIPISMGYAMIAGLPAVYGLYGSVLPILFFGIISSSPRFVFGVDAAPAALTGAFLVTLGVAPFSDDALQVIPVLTLLTAMILLIFTLLGADRLTRFVSSPVMGGFISGIGAEIILMQFPKLFGGNAVHGELFTLIPALIGETDSFNLLSFILGIATIVIILFFKKRSPLIPMTVILMVIGALLAVFTDMTDKGVKLLDTPRPGLFDLVIPDITVVFYSPKEFFTAAFTIAIVVTSETLLSTRNFALKRGDRISGRRELAAYTAAMFSAAISGCCPVNGSVSRTGIADQYTVSSQLMSVTASATMVIILLFATPVVGWLPVPILTGIVISALLGIIEFELAGRLFKTAKNEFVIFISVALAVLIFGTMFGVVAGVIVSFISYIVKISGSAKVFLGCIPGEEGFFSIGRYKGVRQIKGVVIYRFTHPLFFANAMEFQKDIEEAVTGETKAVIVDAGNISSIDVTAAEYLLKIYETMKAKGIRFFLTEHSGELNDALHEYGCGVMLSEWAVLPKIELALRACGIREPYDLEGEGDAARGESVSSSYSGRSALALFEWAFGPYAENRMRELADDYVKEMMQSQEMIRSESMPGEAIRKRLIPVWGLMDEEWFLDIVEMRVAEYAKNKSTDADIYSRLQGIELALAQYHAYIDKRFSESDEDLIADLIRLRRKRELEFKNRDPEAYEIYRAERHEHRNRLREKYPRLLAKIDKVRDELP